MRSITSHTAGVLIVPKGTLSLKKESFVFRTKDSFFMAEMEGFEPPGGVTLQLISSQPRYDHFDTSPYKIPRPLHDRGIIIPNKRGKIKGEGLRAGKTVPYRPGTNILVFIYNLQIDLYKCIDKICGKG